MASVPMTQFAQKDKRSAKTKRRIAAGRHEKIMQHFAEWLETNNDQVADLQEICSAIKVSAATLRRCSKQHLGMSPMQYLWLRRMNRARQELQRGNSQTSVTATAMNFSFWHLGRFAEEYRTLFGESPSATLARYSQSGVSSSCCDA
jgi:methylphosphotriester-DNA--protein-cysteine methyltransferase